MVRIANALLKTLRPLVAAGLLWSVSAACAQGLSTARTEAHAGRVDAAEAAARAVLNKDASNAEAQALLCSLYASIEQRDAAITACEAAASLAPNKSDYALALARAYGEKADHSGALTGMRMVGKIRTNFERAVALDGRGVEALSDLGQFYVDAPGMVGGGVDKARALVAQLQPLSPARAHRLQAMIHAKDKDDAGAVTEYMAAIDAGHTPEAYVDLANFYRSRKQWDKAADNAKSAIAQDKKHGPDTVDAAALLIDIRREIAAAQSALRAYLASPQAGVASFAKAHVLIGTSMTGDAAGAQKEYAAALALASHYDAARKAAHA